MRNNTTEAELRKKAQGMKTLADFAPVVRDAPIVKPDYKPDPYKGTVLLFDGKYHTMVPMGSILALPVNYRNRIIDQPKGQLLIWPDFLEKNKSWLGAWEVSMAMAKGDAEQSKNVMKQISQDTRVLVAVYKTYPVMVLEAPPESVTSAVEGSKK